MNYVRAKNKHSEHYPPKKTKKLQYKRFSGPYEPIPSLSTSSGSEPIPVDIWGELYRIVEGYSDGNQ